MADNTYYALVEQAISDFDSIFNKLKEKKVEYSKGEKWGELGTTGYLIDSGIPTSGYADMIGQLYRVDTIGGSGANPIPTLVNGKIAYFNIGGLTFGDTGVANISESTSNNISTITVSNFNPGYYGSATSISGTLQLAEVTFSGKTHANGDGYTVGGDASKYTLTATKPLGNINIAKGSVVIDLANASTTNNIVASVKSVEKKAGSVAGATISNTEAAPSGYYVSIDVVPQATGTASVTGGYTVTSGYVDEATPTSTTATITGKGDGTTKTVNVLLNTAEVKVGNVSGSADIETTMTTVEDSTKGIAVKASVSGLAVADPTVVREGYIKETTQIAASESVAVTPKTIYIKKGSLGAGTTSENTITLNNITKTDLTLNDGEYSATVYVGGVESGAKYSSAIESGYISESSVNRTLTGSATVTIPQGKVQISTVDTTLNVTDNSSILTESTTDSYKIDVSKVIDISRTVTEGYIKSNTTDVNDPASVTAAKSLYIPKGDFSATATFNAVVTGDIDGDDDKTVPTGFNPFLTTAPTSGDYFTITATATAKQVKAGYIKGVADKTVTETRYMPKAVFEYVQNTDNSKEDFIKVTTGGFIPAGTITEISKVSGTIDYASIALSYSNIAYDKGTGKYYTTVGKGSVDPGYISSGQGVFTNNKLEIDKAVISIPAANKTCSITLGTTPTLTADGKYQFTKTEGHALNVSVNSAGYLATTDGIEDTANCTGTLTLDKATLEVPSTSKISLTATSTTTGLLSSEKTKYVINPSIEDGSVTAQVTRAGYLSTTDTAGLTITAPATTFYVKEGSVAAVNGTDATLNKALAGAVDNSTNAYTVSLDAYTIGVEGAITAGYQDAGKATGTATVTAKSKTIEAAVGAVSTTASSTAVTLVADNAISMTTNPEIASDYVKITASGTVEQSVNVTKAGYLNKGTQITSANVGVSGASYIAKNTTTSFVVGGDDETTIPTLQATSGGTITCKGTINTSDITYTINKHAMGSGVYDEMTRLKSRLAGTLSSNA